MLFSPQARDPAKISISHIFPDPFWVLPRDLGYSWLFFSLTPPSLGVSDSPLILSGHPKLIRDIFIELAELLVSAPEEHTHIWSAGKATGRKIQPKITRLKSSAGTFPASPGSRPGMLQNPPIVLTVNIKI